MKTKWVVPALVVGLLFLWTARENFEDTATIRGPPYGNTPATARQIINIMPPTMLAKIKTHVGASDAMTDVDVVKIVYGSGTNSSPIAQVMSDFYWQIYKPATVTISVAQVNEFLDLQTNQWVKTPGNRADLRQFLTTYFIRGQNGAAQSGYLDSLNTVWGQLQITNANTPTTTQTTTTETKEEKTTPAISNTVMYISIGIAAVSILAVLIVMFLPQRNVL
jgi:hypothetical protein